MGRLVRMRFEHLIICIGVLFTHFVIPQSLGQDAPDRAAEPESISHGWSATDALGRKLPDHCQVGDARPNRSVALFYWTWHVGRKTELGPANVQSIIAANPLAINDYQHPVWKTVGPIVGHHWNEPLFGYYRGTDPWVYRRHAELLADAGVDVVVFDCTNGTLTWKEAYDVLAEVWLAARRDGVATPQIAFLCPFAAHEDSRINITSIYEDIYVNGRYQELWFYWKGKPLLMGYPENLPEHIREFFTFRPGQPDYRRGPTRPDHWGWLEVTPQHGYVPIENGKFEQTTVGVAQNATHQLAPAAMNDPEGSYGRGYTNAAGMNHDPLAIAQGLNFQEQWDHAIALDPELVFVTGWNEWIAGRYENWQGTTNAFPDQFNDEYSRDIEPMQGGFGDNFYYQLVSNIRRYKGLTPPTPFSPPKSIHLQGDIEQWKDVRPEYRHHRGSTMHRDHRGYGSLHYRNSSGRNDIVAAKVTHDPQQVYFLVETAQSITAPGGHNWMTLLIDQDQNRDTGWEGYDLAINRLPSDGQSASIELWKDAKWNRASHLQLRFVANQLMLAVPKSWLGQESNDPLDFEFKWIDNVGTDDIYEFYSNGEAAPGGRFNFRYRELRQ